MSFKTTLTLLVVLIVAVALSWHLGVFSEPGKTKTEPTPVVEASQVYLITPRLPDVTRVRLDVTGRGHLVFEKKGENWQIVEPVTARAVGWELTDLISGFQEARKLETLAAPDAKTLADLGLETPVYTITLEGKDRKAAYLVGKNVVASDNTYVKAADGKDVIVVDQNLKSKIKKDLSVYRDKQIWELKRDKISELIFTNREGTTFNFAKIGDGKWVMTSPVRAPVSMDAITSTINALSTLRAEEFSDDKPADLAAFGLDKPAWKITAVETEKVEPTTKSTQPAVSQPAEKRTSYVILLGNQTGLKSDQVFAKLADKKWVVSVKDSDIKTLLPSATAWRDKKILDLDRATISKIQIRHAGEEIILAKADQDWKLQTGKTQAAADTRTVDAVLETLTGLEAASFIDQPDPKFIKKNRIDQPVCTVTIFAGNKVEPVELTIGDVTPSRMFRYVKRSGQEYVAAVSNEKILPLLKPALAYQNKRVLEFNIDNVKSIELVRGKQTYKVERSDRTKPWTLSSPLAAGADQESVRNVLMALTVLEATEFAGKGQAERYGLQKPQILVKLVTETPPATTKPTDKPIRQEYSLAVSRHEGKVYAVRPDVADALVAVVPDNLYSTLNAELLDRAVFTGIPTDKIDRVEIKRPGSDPVVFEKSGGEWKYPADPVFPVDQSKLTEMISSLAQLKARRFIEFQPEEKFGLNRPHFKITISAGKESWSLVAGQIYENQNRYAQASQRPWVFELSADDYAKLDKPLKDLARPAVTPTPAADNSQMQMPMQGRPGGMEIIR